MKTRMLRITSLLLALLMIFSTFVGAVSVSDFSDFPNDWSAEAMTFAVENRLLQGYKNSTIAPSKSMTRAEMATVLNRAFKAWKQASINFSDVSQNDWFYTEVSKAIAFETFKGTSETQFSPNSSITRAQAFTAIARALKLDVANTSVLNQYSDAADIPSWAVTDVAAMVAAGYVKGSSDATLKPNALLTRAEFAQVMYNIIKFFATSADIPVESGNVMIAANGLVLENITIDGDLIVGANVTDLTLKNVTITGRLLVRDQYDLALNIQKSKVLGGLVAYSPDEETTVYTDTVSELKENLKDHTTVIFQEKTPGSMGVGGAVGSGSTEETPYAIRVDIQDVSQGELEMIIDTRYEKGDDLFELARKMLYEFYGGTLQSGGLIKRAYDLGLEKANENGFLVDGRIPKFEVTDVRTYDVNVVIRVSADTDIDANDLSGEIADALRPDVYDNLSPEQQADILLEMEEEVKDRMKSMSATEKRNWLFDRLQHLADDSYTKLLLSRLDDDVISDAFDSAVDQIPDHEFSLRHEAGSTHYIIHLEHSFKVNDFVDNYFTTVLEDEIIEDCRAGMKAMSTDEKREWMMSKIPAAIAAKAPGKATDAIEKALNKIPDADLDHLYDIGVDLVPDESFTIEHIPGDTHYTIKMNWEVDPIVVGDVYYQDTYIENRVLKKMEEYGFAPTNEEWALYNRLLPSNFAKDMGDYHALLSVQEYYEDAYEIIDLIEAVFDARNYDEYQEKIDKALNKGIPKALDKARKKGIRIVDQDGNDITAAQCIAAARALAQDPHITVDDLLDIFGDDSVMISGEARDYTATVVISRIDISKLY